MGFRNDEPFFDDILIPFCRSGDMALITDAEALPYDFHKQAFILGARLRGAAAPTGASLIADLHLDGVTAFTTQANRPTVLAGAVDSGAWAVPDVQPVPAGTVGTVNVDQIGSALPGTSFTFQLRILTRH